MRLTPTIIQAEAVARYRFGENGKESKKERTGENTQLRAEATATTAEAAASPFYV